MSRILPGTALSVVICLTQPHLAHADELRVWTARAIATVLAEVGPQFERETGYRLNVSSDLPDAFLRRANGGEQFDILITGAGPVDEWIKDGRIVAETRTDIARSGIGVAVRAGARKPDISSVEAFKRALLDARSIAYLKVGSGAYVAGLLERLGIAEAIASKVTRPESDIVSELVAKGDVELGLVVVTQIVTTPGVDLVGPLPPEIQSFVVFTAGVGAKSTARGAAGQLIRFLTGLRAAAVMKAQGLEPIPQRVLRIEAHDDARLMDDVAVGFAIRRPEKPPRTRQRLTVTNRPRGQKLRSRAAHGTGKRHPGVTSRGSARVSSHQDVNRMRQRRCGARLPGHRIDRGPRPH